MSDPDPNEHITKYFTRKEIACRCGCGFCDPTSELKQLLDAIRTALGSPLFATSICRCPKHNAEVGGVPNSYHTQGMAADVCVPGMKLLDLLRLIRKTMDQLYGVRKGGIGYYYQQKFIHIDNRPMRTYWTEK